MHANWHRPQNRVCVCHHIPHLNSEYLCKESKLDLHCKLYLNRPKIVEYRSQQLTFLEVWSIQVFIISMLCLLSYAVGFIQVNGQLPFTSLKLSGKQNDHKSIQMTEVYTMSCVSILQLLLLLLFLAETEYCLLLDIFRLRKLVTSLAFNFGWMQSFSCMPRICTVWGLLWGDVTV